jgi:putative tryptophan/tyrosine transport system substrate-binding protein
MMDRLAFIGTVAGGLLAIPLAAEAQQAGKVHRVGWLGLASPGPEVLRIVDGLRQGLREQGYVEGRDIAFEYRWAHGRADQLPDLAAELVRLKVDILVVASTPVAHAAKRATTTIPIVFVGPDPLSTGLVASLGRPGGNITGVTLNAGPEIVGKYLQLIKEAVPKVSRVAVLWNQGSQMHPVMVREAEVAARALQLQVQSVGVRGADEFEGAFAAMTKERASAVVVLGDPVFLLHRKQLAELAARSRLPAIYALTDHVEAGGLMAYSPNFAEAARRAATYVDKILKGTKPADLPVEQPTKFELVINLKTAKALGLTIPPSVLGRADQVIE